MTAKDLGAKLESLIVGASDILSDGIVNVQDYLYSQLVKVLKDLDLDDSGDIIQSAKNRKVIQSAINTIDSKIRTSGYQAYVENYLGTITKIDQLNTTYFEVLSDAFKPNRQFLASLQKETISQVEGLLFNSGFEAQIKIPLSTILNQNINTGASFTAMLEQVKTFVKGSADVDGKLLRYSKQVTRDALFNYSRAFQTAITSDLGLEWFCYSGGLMDKSRQFCIEHAGHYYPKAQIESWASEDWDGKRSDTTESTIFVYAGGHGCQHSIIPVDKSTVPEEDLQTAIDEGWE